MTVISAALLPVFLLLLYIWWKDTHREPVAWLLLAFLSGGALLYPAIWLEAEIEGLVFSPSFMPAGAIGVLTDALVATAIPEEGLKLLALLLILRWNPHYDEHIDGIVYAVFIGLGFAGAENIIYLQGDDHWVTTAAVRSLLAVPGHYAFAVIMGYYYSMYAFVERTAKHALSTFAVPVTTHAAYDSLAMSGQVHPYAGLVCFFLLIAFCLRMHWMARKRILILIGKDCDNGAARPPGSKEEHATG